MIPLENRLGHVQEVRIERLLALLGSQVQFDNFLPSLFKPRRELFKLLPLERT